MSMPPPPFPPPAPAPPPSPGSASLGCEDPGACVYFDVSDREILTSLGIFAFLAGCLLLLFGVLRHRSPIFFGRRRLRNLTHRPPPIPRPDGTWSDAIFGWMTHVLRVPDKDLVATAGIDALAFIRVCQFGIQLFVPITFVVIIVLVPIHNAGGDLARQKEEFIRQGGNAEELRSGLDSKLMRSTAANLNEGDPVMWIHVVLMWLITLYATWLLRRHTRTFALLRQLYLSTAGDTNLWRAVHMPGTILQQMLVQGRELEAELDVHKMREQVAKAQINESLDPGDQPGEQLVGNTDLLVGPDGQPIMLTSIEAVEQRAGVAGAVATPNASGGPDPPGGPGSNFKPKGGIPTLSTPTRASTGARASLNFDAVAAASNAGNSDGDGSVHKEKVRRGSQLKPLKPSRDGDGASPTVSVSGGSLHGGSDAKDALGRMETMRANMRRSSVNANTFEALAVLATPVLAEKVHHADPKGAKGSAEKVIRQVAKKFGSLTRANTERSALGAKPPPSDKAPVGLGREGLLPVRTSGDRSKVSTDLAPSTGAAPGRASTDRGTLKLMPLRTNAAPGMARRQEEEEAEEARRRRALENQLAAEGGISIDIPDDVDRLPPRAGTANPAYSTPTSAAAAAAAAAAATAGAFDEGPIEAISPIEQVAVSPTTPSSGGGGGGGRRRSNIPVSLRKSIEEARRKASAEVGDRGGSTEATIAEEKSEETDHPPGPGPVTESFVGRGGDGTTEPPDGERETASSDPPVTRPALRTYVDEDGRTTVYMGPPGTTPGGGTAGTQTQQQTGGFLERVRAARRESHPPPGPPTSTADALLSPPRMRGRHSRRGSGGGVGGGGAGGVPLRPPVFELTGAAAEGLEGLIEASKEREKGREKKKRHARNKSDIGAAFATLGLGGIGIDEASTLAGARNNNPNLNPSKSAKNVSGGGGGGGASGDANESGSGASGGGVSVGGSRGGSVGSAAELSLELSHLSSMRSFGSHGGERGGSSGTHSVPLTPLRSMRDALGGGGGAVKNHPKTPASRSHHEKLRSAQKARAMRRGASFHTTDDLRRENSSGSLQNMAASGHSVGGAIDHRPLGQGLSLGNIHFHESAAVNDKPRAPSSKIVARKGFLPADIIGLNPEAYTPHVKRVLEDIAEAHRARAHRRTASGGSSEDGDVFNRATAGATGLDGLSKHSSRNNLSGGNSSRDAAPSGKTSQSDEYFDFLDEHEAGGPDVAIKHRWWAGLNIDSDSDDDDHGDVESRKESKFQAYYVRPEDEDYDHKQLPRHDSLGSENGTQPATDTSVRGPERQRISRGRDETNDKKGQARARRLVEMPVPDVNAKRTVNTYDPDGKRLVSVWAANYTVLMTDLVATRMADGTERYPLEAVEAMFNSLFPDEFRGIIPIFDHREVDRLLDERDELLNTYNKLKERQSRSYQTMYAKRVNDVMTAVDAAWYDLQQCERAVVLAREAALQSDPGPSCFVVFATQKAAAQAAQCLLHSGSRRNFRVQPAPGPDNVNWQSVLYRRNQSMRRVFFIMPMIILLILFPSGIFTVGISMACNVEPPSGLRGFLTWYCSEEAVVFQSIVSGLLPPILLTLWEVFVVSFFMMYLVQAQNVHASLSNTDRRFLRYYYVWVFVNVLMGGITGGALTGFVEDLMDSSNTTYSLQQHLGRVLPISSNFFLVFVFFRAVYLPVQRLIVPHPGIICWAVRKYLCIFKCAVTPRDRTIKYSPRGVRMGREVGVFLMTVMLGLTFCLIAPVMAPACVLFFVMNFVVWRYHVLYVYERGYESNGSMWFTVVELTVWALLISQVFTSFVLFSKAAWIPGLALYLTVPYYLYRYYVNLRSEFGSGSAWSVPLGEAAKAPPADFSAEIYTHPSLRPAAMGWHPDVGKVWRGYPGVAGKTTF